MKCNFCFKEVIEPCYLETETSRLVVCSKECVDKLEKYISGENEE